MIRNVTLDTTLVEEPSFARSMASRIRGLMFRKGLKPGEGLVIEPCNSIHMMFMRFSIDAVFFDRDMRVTRVARRVRPWIGIAMGGRGARGVIELPAGAAADVEPGHQLVVAEAE